MLVAEKSIAFMLLIVLFVISGILVKTVVAAVVSPGNWSNNVVGRVVPWELGE